MRFTQVLLRRRTQLTSFPLLPKYRELHSCSHGHHFTLSRTQQTIPVIVRHSTSLLSSSTDTAAAAAAEIPGNEIDSEHSIVFTNGTREGLLLATNHLLRLTTNELTKVTIDNFSAVMDGWSKLVVEENEREAADYAYSLLKRLEANVDPDQGGDVTNRLKPDTACYNFVLQAYALSKSTSGGEIAESLLDSMISTCRDYAVNTHDCPRTIIPPEPNQQSFNIAINAWAKSRHDYAGTRAEQIFSKMETWKRECQEYTQFDGAAPNSRSICGVMDAWAQSRSKEAAERVMAILHLVVDKKKRQLVGDLSLSGTVVTPVVIMFNSAIHAWVHSNQGKAGAMKAEEVLTMLIELHQSKALGEVDENDENDIGLAPNSRTFTLVMDAWARSEDTEQNGEGAERAQNILEVMIKLYKQGLPVKPNCISFTTVASAWTRCKGSSESAERAEAVLNMMLQLYEETGDENFRPNQATANTVITAWARSGRPDASIRAEAILQKMEAYCQPDIITYNSVLNACSATGNYKLVLDVFRRLKDNTTVEADTISYNTVISAAAKTYTRDGAIQATELLEEMETLYNQGKRHLRPTAFTFSAAMNAWSKSNSEEQADRAYELFQRMLQAAKVGKLSGNIDVVVVTTLISVCANLPKTTSPARKRAALKYAIQSFELLQSDFGGSPNGFTYRMIMKCCRNLTQSNRECASLMEGLFRRCCDDGFVSKIEFDIFRENVPPEIFDKFSVHGEDSRFPSKWCRNVEPNFRPQQVICNR